MRAPTARQPACSRRLIAWADRITRNALADHARSTFAAAVGHHGRGGAGSTHGDAFDGDGNHQLAPPDGSGAAAALPTGGHPNLTWLANVATARGSPRPVR